MPTVGTKRDVGRLPWPQNNFFYIAPRWTPRSHLLSTHSIQRIAYDVRRHERCVMRITGRLNEKLLAEVFVGDNNSWLFSELDRVAYRSYGRSYGKYVLKAAKTWCERQAKQWAYGKIN